MPPLERTLSGLENSSPLQLLWGSYYNDALCAACDQGIISDLYRKRQRTPPLYRNKLLVNHDHFASHKLKLRLPPNASHLWLRTLCADTAYTLGIPVEVRLSMTLS